MASGIFEVVVRSMDETNRLLAETEAELAGLNTRRAELLKKVTELQQEKALFLQVQQTLLQPGKRQSATNQSFQEARIALVRSLFRGREDVYARKF